MPRGRSDPGRGFGPCRYPGSFLLAFREAAAKTGWHLVRLSGETALCHDDDQREHRIGLENIFRRARRQPRTEWPELIAEFLTSLSKVGAQDNLPASLSEVADQLLIRVGTPLVPTATGPPMWSLPLGNTGLVANLVIDYPDRMCYVHESLVEHSDQPGGYWFERARSNLLARTPAACFEIIHEKSGLRMCSVADAYDSSRAFLLPDLFPDQRDSGYLFVIPGRDELLVMPVTAQCIPHVQLLKVLAEKNFRSVPYAISDEVYWLHRDAWHTFPIRLESSSVTIHAPPQFEEILNALLGNQGEAESGADAPP